MLDTIRMFLIAYWYIIVPIITLLFLAIPVIVYWSEVRYWLMKVRLHFPLAGRIRYWVKHPGDKDRLSGFLASESELCSFYDAHHKNHEVDTDFFKKCQDYLAKINEDGRKEKGLGIWALIIILMVIEATAFGYALAPFALTLATPNTALAGAFAIGLVISIIGLILSEFAGRSFYKNAVVGHVMSFEEIRASGSDGDMVKKDIIHIDNTYDDNHRPEYQQMLNRVKVPKNGAMPAKRFGVIVAYGIFILGLAVAAFWVRTETLNAQEADLIANPPAVSQAADDFPVAEEDFPITEEMAAIGQAAAGKSAQDQIDALHRASLVTFAVLSGLFIFIQASSTYLAFIFGFAGTKSREAWEKTHKFANADEFKRHHDAKARSIAVDAQNSLGTLQAAQHKIFRVSGTGKETLEQDRLARTFENYLRHERTKKVGDATSKLMESYVNKVIDKAQAAITDGNTAGGAKIIAEAAATFAQIDASDPTLGPLKQKFEGMQRMFAPAPTAPAVTAAAQVEPVTPAPALGAEPIPVLVAAPAPAQATTKFDHNAWGDLTDYHEDDLDYVASKQGVELAQIQRARRLQLLDKQGA
ncbi:conserved membrane hypothetical protein [Pseudomonas sp. 8AS]|uniref:hypothetical protein n=1 Tax=Pseudomonas sp. 8AS TaxID=2653163 RepID=UPI0012F39125|nr:hypothetical protein [Pseudomonas sp. 8AS]VXA98150.1 conserved membrane hypothetical protein [Pseudomonas sp. 8AS]